MFIWLFHRISGVTLIVLFGIKILTSYFLFTKDQKPDWALSLHRHPVLDVLILILFTFHSIYGLRTIVIDFGYRKEKLLFWVANGAATVVSVALLVLYFRFSQA
jgi:succinate dehydrogenase/fumarate reductase cytochrome b subunit